MTWSMARWMFSSCTACWSLCWAASCFSIWLKASMYLSFHVTASLPVKPIASRAKPSRFMRYMGYFLPRFSKVAGWNMDLAAEFSATRFATACITFLCSLPKRLAISRLDATGSPFWVDKIMSFKVLTSLWLAPFCGRIEGQKGGEKYADDSCFFVRPRSSRICRHYALDFIS